MRDHFFPLTLLHNRDGDLREAPEAFEGRTNVVLLVADEASHVQAASWLPWLQEREETHEGFAHYELVLSACNERCQVHDDSRTRFHTTHVPSDIHATLELSDSTDVKVLTVSHEGLVHHVEVGPFDPSTAARLANALLTSA